VTYEVLITIVFLILGHLFGWFATNSQLVWTDLANWPITTMILVGLPASLCFWYGTKFGYVALGSLWAIRLISFAVSYTAFPIVTYLMLGESMFTGKTMTCVALSMLILAIQILWK